MFPSDQFFDAVTESSKVLDMQSTNKFYITQSISCSYHLAELCWSEANYSVHQYANSFVWILHYVSKKEVMKLNVNPELPVYVLMDLSVQQSLVDLGGAKDSFTCKYPE